MDTILLTLILGFIVAGYFYLTKNYRYWHSQNIPCTKRVLPGLGHTWPMIFCNIPLGDFFQRIYESFPDRSMVGFYNKTTPALVIREPQLIRTIMQINFENFSKNLLEVDVDLDPLLAMNPFFIHGNKWFAIRNTWAHMFSNTKLKILFGRVEPVCKKLEDYLDQKLSQNNGAMEIKIDDIITKYISEVIANVGYGVQGFCFDDTGNTFAFDKISDATLGSSLRARLTEYIYFFMPELNRILRISYFSQSLSDFLRKATKLVQEDPHKDNMLGLILDKKKNDGEECDENMLFSYAFSFLHASYATSRMTIIFVLYQLARHPHVQQKLRDEVKTVLAKYDGCLTYEALKEMSYMDQVISEVQRINTIVSFLPKVCTNECELNGSDGLSCRVQPGVQIFVPVGALHMDSKYWPDPHVFDPDRFAPHRKVENEKFTFLPFGEGPRLCVGMKLALMQIKFCLATMIGKYTLEMSPKTEMPLKMLSGKFINASRDIWFIIK